MQFVINNGNTTTYEYTYGEKPISVEEPLLNIEEDKGINNDNEIDFGEQIDFGEGSGEIDYGEFSIETVDPTSSNKGDIDWGSLNIDEGFEIVEHSDVDINLEESGIVVEKSGEQNHRQTVYEYDSSLNKLIK